VVLSELSVTRHNSFAIPARVDTACLDNSDPSSEAFFKSSKCLIPNLVTNCLKLIAQRMVERDSDVDIGPSDLNEAQLEDAPDAAATREKINQALTQV
jgi:hypothetical protein